MSKEYTAIIPDNDGMSVSVEGMITVALENDSKLVTVMLFASQVAELIGLLGQGLNDRLTEERRSNVG